MKTRMGRQRKRKTALDRRLPAPSAESIATISRIIERSVRHAENKRKYAAVKHVLALLGIGTVLGLSLVAPTALVLAKPFLDAKRQRDRDEWKKFHPSYLRQTISRLRKQRMIKTSEQDGESFVELTDGGRRRILRYALDELAIEKPAFWDGKWRVVLYDVLEKKAFLRNVFRQTLRSLGFYRLQESVWLHPYPCEDQVAFLREYYGIGSDVLYLVVDRLEDDAAYKTYFGLT